MIFMVRTMRNIMTIKITITNNDNISNETRGIEVYPTHCEDKLYYHTIIKADHSADFYVWDEQSLIIKEIEIEPEIIPLNKDDNQETLAQTIEEKWAPILYLDKEDINKNTNKKTTPILL